MNQGSIGAAVRRALEILCGRANPPADSLLVVGCSTSVILGQAIGQASSVEVAEEIFDVLLTETEERHLRLAVQCCEHLNRALVVNRAGPDVGREVHAFPVPGAGGTLAAVARLRLPGAWLVESVSATLGLDIGQTWVGMHLRPVVVPVHFQLRVGEATVSGGFSRPPLIGGTRAVYRQEEAEAALERRRKR